MRTAITVFGSIIGAIVLFTILTGGSIGLGTSSAGPFLNFGFKGPQAA